MEYHILVAIPTVVTVEANSEQEAKDKIEADLIRSEQIRPYSPLILKVIEEATVSEETEDKRGE